MIETKRSLNMKTVNLVILVIFVLLKAAILPTACVSLSSSVKEQKDKESRKESREKRMAYQSAHHSND